MPVRLGELLLKENVVTPQQVKEQVKRQVSILNENGGFVFNTVHNIQANVPFENVVAMLEALKEIH